MIKIDLNIGDTIYVGKFRNKPLIVKTIKYDEFGLPLINDKKIVNFKIKKENKMNEGIAHNNIRKAVVAIRKFEDKYPKHKLNIGYNSNWISINGKNIIDLYKSDINNIYNKLLSVSNVKEDLISGGKGDNTSSNKLSEKELEVGIMIEREHTKSDEKAKEIATDHLTEDPQYYSKLIKSGLVDEQPALALAKKLGLTESINKDKLKKMIFLAKKSGAKGYDIIKSLSNDLGWSNDKVVRELEKNNLIKLTENMIKNKLKKIIKEELKNHINESHTISVSKLVDDFKSMDAEEMETYFAQIVKYMYVQSKYYDNIDYVDISRHLTEIFKKIRNRTGN